MWLRGALGCGWVFTVLICRGCNLCKSVRSKVHIETKNTNGWIGKCVDICSMSLVCWGVNVNMGIMLLLRMVGKKALAHWGWWIILHTLWMHKKLDYLTIDIIASTSWNKVLFRCRFQMLRDKFSHPSHGTIMQSRERGNKPTKMKAKEANILLFRQV